MNQLVSEKTNLLPQIFSSTNPLEFKKSEIYENRFLTTKKALIENEQKIKLCETVHFYLSNLNLKETMSPNQIKFFVDSLVSEFPDTPIQVVTNAIRFGVFGRFGVIYKIDIHIIFSWIEKYQDEYQDFAIERREKDHQAKKFEAVAIPENPIKLKLDKKQRYKAEKIDDVLEQENTSQEIYEANLSYAFSIQNVHFDKYQFRKFYEARQIRIFNNKHKF